MLAAVVAQLLVPLLASSVVELDPYHTHVVVGGTPREQAHALAHHRHDRAAHEDMTQTHDRPGVRVLSVTSGPLPGTVVSVAGGASASVARIEIPAPQPSGTMVALSRVPGCSATSEVLAPPPRAA